MGSDPICRSYILSREGYQKFLYDEATNIGASVRFNSRVDKVEDNADRPVVTLTDGSRYEADVIVGCDGEFKNSHSFS